MKYFSRSVRINGRRSNDWRYSPRDWITCPGDARHGAPHKGWTDEEAPEVQQVRQDRLGAQVGASEEQGYPEEVGKEDGTQVDDQARQTR